MYIHSELSVINTNNQHPRFVCASTNRICTYTYIIWIVQSVKTHITVVRCVFNNNSVYIYSALMYTIRHLVIVLSTSLPSRCDISPQAWSCCPYRRWLNQYVYIYIFRKVIVSNFESIFMAMATMDLSNEIVRLRAELESVTAQRDLLLCEVSNLRRELEISELKHLQDDRYIWRSWICVGFEEFRMESYEIWTRR